jgi:hypothetical protein
MYDEKSCLGCHRSFETLKRLRAHEAACASKKQLQVNVLESQRHLENAQKIRKLSSPEPIEADDQAVDVPAVDEDIYLVRTFDLALSYLYFFTARSF